MASGKMKERRKGFTLGELVVTTAVISTIAVITVPSYMRYRADAEYQMVRQIMRQIGEKMIEILGKNGAFPSSENWPNLLNGEDELAITASLSALRDGYCMDIDDYWTSPDADSFIFRIEPDWGRACSRRWQFARRTTVFNASEGIVFPVVIHYNSELSPLFMPGVVGTLNSWDGVGLEMMFLWPPDGAYVDGRPTIFSEFFEYMSNHPEDYWLGVEMFAKTLAQTAVEFKISQTNLGTDERASTLMVMSEPAALEYERMLPIVHAALAGKGINVYMQERSVEYAELIQYGTEADFSKGIYVRNYGSVTLPYIQDALNAHESPKVYEMVFQMDAPITNSTEGQSFMAANFSTPSVVDCIQSFCDGTYTGAVDPYPPDPYDPYYDGSPVD